MPPIQSGSTVRRLAWFVSLLYLALIAWVMFGILQKPVPGYTSGEWLVNYRCGFERRGLGGEILYWLAAWSGRSPLWLLNQWVPWFTVAAMAVMVWLCVRRWWLLLLLATSPLGLLFWVNNPEVVGRRDPYLLLLFGLSSWLIMQQPRQRLLWWLLPLSTLGYLLHDGYFFFSMPLLGWLLLAPPGTGQSNDPGRTRQALVYFAHGIGMLALMYLATLHDASAKIGCLTENARQAMAAPGAPEADAAAIFFAIEWQGRGIGHTVLQTAKNYLQWNSLLYWLLQASLALMAIRWLVRQWPPSGAIERNSTLFRLGGLAGMAIWAALFVMAIDWGRYIHILFMQFLIVAALTTRRQPGKQSEQEPGFLFVALCLTWSLVTVQMVYQGGALDKRMWGYLLDKLLHLW
ncbi:MAG: hypothetical protein MUF29_03920 [Chitinophagaceae bacterium]|nr:hypothetical protein [Chitinophagaceae bacterium]